MRVRPGMLRVVLCTEAAWHLVDGNVEILPGRIERPLRVMERWEVC